MSNVSNSLESAFERLERAWWEQGRPSEHRLRPGLSDGEIDALMEPTGLQLPGELRQWFSWRDGSEHFGPWSDDIPGAGPGWWLHLSLAEALELDAHHRASWEGLIDRGDAELADMMWKPGFIPFTRGAGTPNHVLVIDPDETTTNTVRLVTEMGIQSDRPTLTLVELVNAWARMLETGAYEYVDGGWQARDEMYLDPDPAWPLVG